MRVRMGRKPRRRVPCAVPGCPSLAWARGLCGRHLKRQRRRLICNVVGCVRRVDADGRCKGHRDDPRRAVRPARPRRSDRILAWGRLVLQRDAARRVEEEARRRGMSPFRLRGIHRRGVGGGRSRAARSNMLGCRMSSAGHRLGTLPDPRASTGARPAAHAHQAQAARHAPGLAASSGPSGRPAPQGSRKRWHHAGRRSPTSAAERPQQSRPTRPGRVGPRRRDANRRPPMPAELGQRPTEAAAGLGVSVAEVVRWVIARQQS
jgi:hypothetical protein